MVKTEVGGNVFRDLGLEDADKLLIESLRTQLAETQTKLQETCLQVAGAVWATAAPDKVVDIQTCVNIVKMIMQEQTK